jgi:CubicO group peptidase (beta-lactamase class C family)
VRAVATTRISGALGGVQVGAGRHPDDARGRIGSISKTFTAIAVMQLRGRGLVDLDDPVSEHLRSYRLAPAQRSFRPATIRHLLTHTGGIGEVRGLTDLFRPTR